MEKNFYRDEFESMLREQSDSFKMFPSKKTWHGIYNNLHPAKRWPSASMSIIMIFSLVLLGHLNTQHNQDLLAANAKNGSSEKNIQNTPSFEASDANTLHTAQTSNLQNLENNTDQNNPLIALRTDDQNAAPVSSKRLGKVIRMNNFKIRNSQAETEIDADDLSNNISGIGEESDNENIISEDQDSDISLSKKLIEKNNSSKDLLSALTEINGDQHSLNNLLKGKKASKFSMSYYVSPTVNFRTFSESENNNPNPQMSMLQSSVSNEQQHQPAIGFELGSNINYTFSENIKIITGVQLNYSGYNVTASGTHPGVASLRLTNDNGSQEIISTISTYANNTSGGSPITLRNYSLQASVPIGMQYKLAGNENIALIINGTIQPFYVISSNAYFLSSDKRNYMTYPSLVRDFNISTQLGTVVQFSGSSFNWQVGPQFRYQLMSTYTNASPYKERLINYGLRLGISKKGK